VVEGLVRGYGTPVVTEARITMDVDAPPETTWAVISDPRNLPRWDRHITGVEGVPDQGLDVGVRYATELRFMGVAGVVDAQVLEWDPPRSSRIRLRGFIEAVVHTRVEPLPHGRSRIVHEVRYGFRGGPVGTLAAHALRVTGGPQLVLRRGTLAQKRQVEEG
jgi:uncharacterized protein YndB with AHSA1/START domain